VEFNSAELLKEVEEGEEKRMSLLEAALVLPLSNGVNCPGPLDEGDSDNIPEEEGIPEEAERDIGVNAGDIGRWR